MIKKLMNILSIFLISTVATGFAYGAQPTTASSTPISNNDMTNNCFHKISEDPDYLTVMGEIFKEPTNFNQEFVTANKSKILATIAADTLILCLEELPTIATKQNGKVWYKANGKTYAFQFKTEELFQLMEIKIGIMVYNKRDKKVGDVIKLSDIPKLYWSDECSDHTIAGNLDDDIAVNKAGQSVFSQYGGSQNEFFLDFEEGNNRRAFPGLVLMDATTSTAERIVTFNNLQTALTAAQQFATALNGSACSNDGLAVYPVALDVKKLDTNKDAWGLGAGIAGGAVGLVATAATLKAFGVTTATTTLLKFAGALTAAGPGLWIFAGALAAGAGVYSLKPEQISDIQQVMILGGPFLVK